MTVVLLGTGAGGSGSQEWEGWQCEASDYFSKQNEEEVVTESHP